MKKDAIQSFIQMDKEALEKLIAEVKATVAAIIHLPGDNRSLSGQ